MTAKVLRNGQITIPKQVRDAIGLTEGGTVVVRVTGPGQATLTALRVAAPGDLFGSLPPRDPGWSLAAARREYEEARTALAARDRADEDPSRA